MSENKNDKKDKKNEPNFDPYSFFKFAGSENDDNSGKKNEPNKKNKYTIFLIIGLILSALLIANVFFMNRDNDLIDFTEFKKLISSGEIVRVEISSPYFTGYTTPKSEEKENSNPFQMLLKTKTEKVYKTVGLGDESLYKFMDESNVA